MKIYKKIIILLILSISIPSFGFDKEKLEHRITVGFNVGASFPIPIPREVRTIEGWWPQFTPQFGYSILYSVDPKWSFGSGISLDYKGMGAKDKVKYMHIEVRLEEDGEILNGYFSGKNETRAKLSYVTVPVFARYQLSDNWYVRGGGYASYAFSTSFKGKVWDGYLRAPDPTGMITPLEGDSKATFDFGSDIRSFDFGVLLGAERRINQKFNAFANLNWGLTPLFKKDFKAMDFEMYNLYFTLGFAYKL
ncbi:porin family protein [Dysgonomonas sp. 520]|uniref:porin family protein n=1 Tax=Dysgonomonas sp. 520 TaxID=2302931 RepID=UPI0013D1749C|nr:porin family protein [Dysgonomonas sp. 520]NDW09733.1 PorT family protein [Dysgonomonas sp. 520]